MMTFPPMKNDRLLRVIHGQPVDKTPVWIMRQAGRYLPEFRAVRLEHDFFQLCRTPELACTVTLQPIDRYAGLFDASIIFSDILVIPQALGMDVQMLPQKGPHFPEPLEKPADISKLETNVDVQLKLGYVMDAIRLTRQRLDGRVPLHGFCGAPWTLMAYMIEGGGSKTFTKAKKWLFQFPEASHQLLTLITNLTIDYLSAQVDAGAQILQVFESWAGELAPVQFSEFSLSYLRKIVDGVKKRHPTIPMVVFAKGAHFALEELFATNYSVIGLDWTMDIGYAKEKARQHFRMTGKRVVLQGNMDPGILYAPAELIRKETRRTIRSFLLKEDDKTLDTEEIGYICNLGHGIQPEVPVENVQVFLEAVREFSSEVLRKL